MSKLSIVIMTAKNFIVIFAILLYSNVYAENAAVPETTTDSGRYTIEGKLSSENIPITNQDPERPRPPGIRITQPNWWTNVKVHVNGGEYIGFVKNNGNFVVNNVPSGSYIIDILHPDYAFEQLRVEINSKGKIRSRAVNHIQSVLQTRPYPLRPMLLGKTRYFQMREQWRIADFLFNPMVLMMVLPLVLVMILPKMMNDPETKKEMEQIQSLTKFEMPEVGDMMSNFLAGSQTQQPKKSQKAKKKQQ